MKTDFETFNRQCDLIDREFAELTTRGITVTDGVIDRERYYRTFPRLMWVLKEADSGDSWSYIDKFRDRRWMRDNNSLPALRRVYYTTYGILRSGERPWSDFPGSTTDECLSALREIAFINLKKSPGGATSVYSELLEASVKHRKILKMQIETYDPEVVIFGNTLRFFSTDDFTGLSTAEKRISPLNNHYYFAGDKLYIYAHHPGYWKISDEDYVMDIVGIYRQWRNRR